MKLDEAYEQYTATRASLANAKSRVAELDKKFADIERERAEAREAVARIRRIFAEHVRKLPSVLHAEASGFLGAAPNAPEFVAGDEAAAAAPAEEATAAAVAE